MQTTVSQWGNSLGVRIPKSLLESLEIKKGTKVSFSLRKNKIVLEPVLENSQDEEVDLDALLAQIDPNNIPEDPWKDVKPVGNEIW